MLIRLIGARVDELWRGWRAECGAGSVADICPWALSLSHSQFPMLVLGDRPGAKQKENTPNPSLRSLVCVVPPSFMSQAGLPMLGNSWSLHSLCSFGAALWLGSAPHWCPGVNPWDVKLLLPPL